MAILITGQVKILIRINQAVPEDDKSGIPQYSHRGAENDLPAGYPACQNPGPEQLFTKNITWQEYPYRYVQKLSFSGGIFTVTMRKHLKENVKYTIQIPVPSSTGIEYSTPNT